MGSLQPFVIRIDDAGHIGDVSESALELLSANVEDLLGAAFKKLVHTSDFGEALKAYRVAAQNPAARTTVPVRLNPAGGTPFAAELIMVNLGSKVSSDMYVEVRPRFPEPPSLPPEPEDAAESEWARFQHFEISDGLSHIQNFLDLGAHNFMVVMISINGVDDHLDELVEELGTRLRASIRGTDRLFRHTNQRLMLVAAGLEERNEIGVVLDRLRACLSFPFTVDEGETIVPTGSIGVALPGEGHTPDYMVFGAMTQLRLAAVQDGAFPYAVERRPWIPQE